MIDDAFDSLPPHSLDAERCLLAALIIDRPQAEELVPALQSDDFILSDHQILFATIRELVGASRPVDLVILRDELSRGGALDAIGGAAYLAQVVASLPSAAHAGEYASRVREHAALRRIMRLADDVSRRAQRGEEHAAAIAGEMAHATGEILAQRSSGDLLAWDDLIDGAYEAVGAGGVETVHFGWHSLDNVTGGIALGESVILAARPSMGKSTIARNVAVNAASAGHPVGIISLEESPEKIARNALSAGASVTNHRLRHATDVAADEYKRLAMASGRLRGLPIVVSRRARSVDEIRATATTMRARHGIKLLIVDHLARVRAPGRNIYEQVTAASGSLTDLVKDLGVAGLILSQLNRDLEKRDSQRPTMADLRDSGSIEQDADGVILLHREDYFRTRDPNYIQDGVAELTIAKWRDGVRGGTVKLKSELSCQRFTEFSEWPLDGPTSADVRQQRAAE